MNRHLVRKRFGQHFLHDAHIIDRIVSTIAPQPGQVMIEIGPGLGAITVPLLGRLETLEVVELDRDVIPELQAACAQRGELRVHNDDALRFDFASCSPGPRGLRIVGNLPYNISTPLLFHLLASVHAIQDLHFLLQKEVADRVTATAGTRDYGRLSVMVQYRCQVERLFNVGSGAFSPPPKVHSAFVRLRPYQTLPFRANNESVLEQVVAKVFSQRRKTLRNALRGCLCTEQIEAAGIDPAARGETLSVAQFVALVDQTSGL